MSVIQQVKMTEAAHKRIAYLARETSEYLGYCSRCDVFLMELEIPGHPCDEMFLVPTAPDAVIPPLFDEGIQAVSLDLT